MRFLIDAQLPPALARWIVERGHDADHVHDIGLGAAADAAIASHTENTGAILVSKDEDFLNLRLPDRFPLLWIRIGNCTTATLLARLSPRWTEIVELFEHEALVEFR